MWVYDKSGNFILGLPARDISDDEWRELPADERAQARHLKLYTHEADDEPAKKAETKAETPKRADLTSARAARQPADNVPSETVTLPSGMPADAPVADAMPAKEGGK